MRDHQIRFELGQGRRAAGRLVRWWGFKAMARIVLKFGGTSVGDIDRIKNVARKVKAEVDAGHQVAVVVSAMSGVTNKLVEYCAGISPLHDAREYDAVVASGEQVTSGLTALALQELGIPARSWQGWQIPIRTDDVHAKARICSIETEELERRLSSGEVAVVAGFQGVSPNGRIATLGRGGSDTSAVALAAALKADRCDIYTDVDGVYTTDPASCRRPASCPRSPTRKCWRWRRSAPRCSRPARSRWP